MKPRRASPRDDRRPRRRWLRLAATVLVLLVLTAASVFAFRRETAPLGSVTASITAPHEVVAAPGVPPPIPMPLTGALSLASDVSGVLADFQADQSRPIGSVAKALTALVVLIAHPLAGGEAGPGVTLTRTDVDLYRQAVAAGGSALPVRAGEVLSELDLLLAMMLPSANNIAETLARWVSGDRATFIAQLNTEATTLGMLHTHFDDPSGYSAQTTSTASDLVRLASAVISNQALAAIVATDTATLPDGTVLHNLDSLLATPGWLGIKTGWTQAAGGCLLFAVRRTYAPAPAPVTLFGAVLGQPASSAGDPAHPELGGALQAASQAVSAAWQGYTASDVGSLDLGVGGMVTSAWGDSSGVRVQLDHADPIALRIGASLPLRLSVHPVTPPVGRGAVLGGLALSMGSHVVAAWILLAATAIPEPSWWWKLWQS